MDASKFWLVYILIILVLIVIFIVKFGIPKGYIKETTLTFDQLKGYFFKKHHCKHCRSKLLRISEKEYKGTGWFKSSIDPSEFRYGEKYEITFFLECPNCHEKYTSDNF